MVVCHCTDCQSLSGTAFRAAAFTLEDAFMLERGEPRLYTKVAESGRERLQAFCGACGSPLYATAPGAGSRVCGLRAGTLDQRDRLEPGRQVWARSAQRWLDRLASLPLSAKQA